MFSDQLCKGERAEAAPTNPLASPRHAPAACPSIHHMPSPSLKVHPLHMLVTTLVDEAAGIQLMLLSFGGLGPLCRLCRPLGLQLDKLLLVLLVGLAFDRVRTVAQCRTRRAEVDPHRFDVVDGVKAAEVLGARQKRDLVTPRW